MYWRVSCGSGTEVTRSRHSSPSLAAAIKPASSASVSGRSVMPRSDSVMACTQGIVVLTGLFLSGFGAA